ncbi:MAG: DUF433 domain-containing protein [Caldilineaceae bacterium]
MIAVEVAADYPCARVCGGRPTFKYTRIEIAGTLERIAAGEAIDEIVAGYRGRVNREALLEALQLGQHSL